MDSDEDMHVPSSSNSVQARKKATTKRRTKKDVSHCPNPLFEKWIKEWRDEAYRKGWKSHYNYSKALKSLQLYPLPLKSGKEAKILDHFGEKICKMLDEKLAAHYAQNGVSNEESLQPSQETKKSSEGNASDKMRSGDAELETQKPSKKKKTGKENSSVNTGRAYIPSPGTGAFAILVTLYKCEVIHNILALTKEELIEKAQPLADTSFLKPKPGTYYTAWSSMSLLVKKGLVIKGVGKPIKYGLTDSGRKLAGALAKATRGDNPDDSLQQINFDEDSCSSQIHKYSSSDESSQEVWSSQNSNFSKKFVSRADEINSNDENSLPSLSSSQSSESSQPYVSFTLPPGSFEVVLCIDVCESFQTGSSMSKRVGLFNELRKNGVNCDVRKLHVGDFLWIAKEKVQPVAGSLRLPTARELVLDFVIERKRMDDLAGSIKDGRFHEQKFRLLNSGLRRPIYLIEEYGTGDQFGIPVQSLEQAIVNTQVIDGFTIRRTKDHRESVAYLTLMTRYLQSMYGGKSLTSCSKEEIRSPSCHPDKFLTFSEFNISSAKSKHLTVEEMFAKHLLQFSGLSAEKVLAILDHYPTVSSLLEGYSKCSTKEERENMLAKIKCGKSQRKLGPVLSKSICQLYCSKNFPFS